MNQGGQTLDRPARAGVSTPQARYGAWGIACILLTLASASALHARETAGEPAGSIFVESIRVQGLSDASERVLLATTRLAPGQTYSEADLESARARLRGLAFVYDARFALERGSRRDAHVLVIEIEATRRFFFGFSAEAVAFDGDIVLGSPSARPASLTDSETGLAVTAGVRHFVGSRGVAFAAAGDEGFEVGYTQHDLFGRGAFLAASVAARDFEDRVFPLGLDPRVSAWNLEDTLQLRIDGGVPIGGRHTLRFGVELLTDGAGQRNALFETGSRTPADAALEVEDAEYVRLDSRWVVDTTDDPVFPTRGYSAHAGLALQSLDAGQTRVTFASGGDRRASLPDHRARLAEAFAGGDRHWPLGRRQTVSLGVVARWGRSRLEGLVAGSSIADDENLSTFAVAASARYGLTLRTPRRLADRGETRLEVRAGYAYESTSPGLGLAGNPLERREIGVAVVQRTAWGLLRVGLTFLDLGESVPPGHRLR